MKTAASAADAPESESPVREVARSLGEDSGR